MAYVIALPCIGTKDIACVKVCPVDAIHPLPGANGFEQSDQLFINPDGCVCCHLCVDECPVSAIFAEEDLPAEWTSFIAKNADHFK